MGALPLPHKVLLGLPGQQSPCQLCPLRELLMVFLDAPPGSWGL